MGAPDAAISQTQIELTKVTRPPGRFNRGVWIRFVLAIIPTVTFAVLGAIQQHLQAH